MPSNARSHRPEQQEPPLMTRLRSILRKHPDYTAASLIIAMRPTPAHVTLALLDQFHEEAGRHDL